MNDEKVDQLNQDRSEATGNKPVEVLRDGGLKAAIFRNEREGKAYFAVEPGRIYTDSEGQVREAKSFSPGEALRVSRLMERSYDRIGEFKAELKTQVKAPEKER